MLIRSTYVETYVPASPVFVVINSPPILLINIECEYETLVWKYNTRMIHNDILFCIFNFNKGIILPSFNKLRRNTFIKK